MKITKAIIIDPRNAGSSGDMFLSVFLDLFEDKNSLNELVELINKKFKANMSVDPQKINKKSIHSTHLSISIENDIEKKHAKDLMIYCKMVLEELEISDKAKKLAEKMLMTLFEAESKVHGEDIEELHLHETASLDTILDIIGTVLLLERNNALERIFIGLPVNVGSGFVTFSHGKMAVPPPAVLEILKAKEYPFFSDEVDGELLTPTGAAILTNLVTKKLQSLPPVKIDKIGYGAGNKDLENRSNVIRVMSAEFEDDSTKNYLMMLETHLDDVTGELLGGVMKKLYANHALDVSYYSLFMKKNRPAYALRVICDEDNSSELAKIIMQELGTLGVRESRFARYELERRVITREFFIEKKKFKCRFKERILDGKVIGAKPEFDDMITIHEETNIPLVDLENKLINFYNMGDEFCE
ncbi:MAG: nickel pincer cofactor biosynthesis protein LarC [Candidatus Heimdallarchaeota archaeon]|nr:nickel pincer cofactor biosynthesis protein LarC [Candidatus Heimdallarchaeota archaeon]